MSVSGHNMLDENGNPWVARGWNYGHGELWNTGDPAADKAMGANCVRILARAWGGGSYSGSTQDGQQLGAFGDWSPAYLAYIKAQAIACKLAGLKVWLGMDSNCGQNGNQTGFAAGCSLYDGTAWQPAQNYFTALGIAQEVPSHLNRARILLRALRGLVDVFEPLVEPAPPGVSQSTINAFLVQVMNVALEEDPNLIFCIGGVSYQHNNTADPMNQGTIWPTQNIVPTCDLLDNIMSSDDTTYAGAVTDMTQARKSTGYPVVCQQAGTVYTSDADGSLFANRAEQLRTASGGSIGFIFWERVSHSPGSYGPWYDASNDGSSRQVANGGAARLAAIQAAFRAAPIYPT